MSEPKSKWSSCAIWLGVQLAEAPVSVATLLAEAKHHGYSREDLTAAVKELNVRSITGPPVAWSLAAADDSRYWRATKVEYDKAAAMERARCQMIICSDAAIGRRSLALHLACQTDMEPAEAIKTLLVAPLETLGGRNQFDEYFAAGDRAAAAAADTTSTPGRPALQSAAQVFASRAEAVSRHRGTRDH